MKNTDISRKWAKTCRWPKGP